MVRSYRVAMHVDVLTTNVPIARLRLIAVNAFVWAKEFSCH